MTNKTSQLFDQAELEIYLLRVVRILIETIVRTNPKQAGVLSELLQKEYLTLQQSGSLKLAKAFELLYRIEGGLEGRQLLTDLDNNGHPH